MKILYHHRTQGKGVEGVHILGFVNAWRKRGHEVVIVSPPKVSVGDDMRSRAANGSKDTWKSLSRHMPEIFFELLEITYNIWGFLAISKEIKHRKCNLIYERYAFLCFSGILNAICYRIPFLLEVNFTTNTPIVRKRTRFISFFDRLIEKFIFKRATGLVVISTYLKDRLVESGINPEKILIVPNAADPVKFQPLRPDRILLTELGVEKKKIIGFVGFFYPWHGIDLLLDAFDLIAADRNDAVCVLVGDGPIMPTIRKRVLEKHLENQVLLLGVVPHELIPRYISMFDVAVMPHSNIYGSPMKIPEYMAVEKALVAPRLSPIEDIVRDNETGLLFQPQDTDDLARKILVLLNDESFRAKMAGQAREYILHQHNWDNNGQKILEHFSLVAVGGGL